MRIEKAMFWFAWLTVLCGLDSQAQSSDPFGNWQWRNPLPQGHDLLGVSYGGGKWVAVGAGGTILSSATALDWTIEPPVTQSSLNSVAYGDKRWIAVGTAGTILKSDNGVTWHVQNLSKSVWFSSVAYGNGRWVAVGGEGMVISSNDGVNWVSADSKTRSTLWKVQYGDEKWIAVGGEGTVILSNDGVNWTGSTAPTKIGLTDIAYGNGKWVGTAGDKIISSLDGESWIVSDLSQLVWSVSTIEFADGKWVAIGSYGPWSADNPKRLLTSINAVEWTMLTIDPAAWKFRTSYSGGTTTSPKDIAYHAGKWVAVGEYGNMMTSLDGLIWRRGSTSATFLNLTAVAHGKNQWLAIGRGVVVGSYDGLTWTERQLPPDFRARSDYRASNYQGICFAQNRWVILPENGPVLTSTDGFNWIEGSSAGWLSVAFGGGQWVAGGPDGIYTSPDGVNWTSRHGEANISITRLLFVNQRWFGIGGRIWESPDGIKWSSRSSGFRAPGFAPADGIFDMAFGNGHWVGVGSVGTIMTSPDAATWTLATTAQAYFTQITYENGIFFAVGGRIILTSRDGAKWDTHTIPALNGVTRIGYEGGRLIAVGQFGTILEATDRSNERDFADIFPRINPGNVGVPENPALRYSVVTPREQNQDSVVYVVHGLQPDRERADITWVDNMVAAIRAKTPSSWKVDSYKWLKDAGGTPWQALKQAEGHGKYLGKELSRQGWPRVHLIGHSAGAGLIQSASERMRVFSKECVIHTTFLDAFTGVLDENREKYGLGSNWADSYFAHDFTDKLLLSSRTEGILTNCFNVDVTLLDEKRYAQPYFCPGMDRAPMVMTSCGNDIVSFHWWPHDFYQETITSTSKDKWKGLGFPASIEGGGWDVATNTFRIGNTKAESLNEVVSRVADGVLTVEKSSRLDFAIVPAAKSETGVEITGNGFRLQTTMPEIAAKKNLRKEFSKASEPAWFAAGLTLTGRVNFVSFDAQFASSAVAPGLLTAYWNTNLIGSIDEMTSVSGSSSYSFALSETFASGNHVLGFRLDAYTNLISSVIITNLTLGYVGSKRPMALKISRDSKDTLPLLSLSGDSGFQYAIEVSNNLFDWNPIAWLLNTNGVVTFFDQAATNANQRYYRAVLR